MIRHHPSDDSILSYANGSLGRPLALALGAHLDGCGQCCRTLGLAEALAEYTHLLIRRDMGIDRQDKRTKEEIFRQGYQGSRYSFGYPACPNLEDQTKLFQLLPGEKIGVHLSETFQMAPEQSTSAIIVHHPQAKYFGV